MIGREIQEAVNRVIDSQQFILKESVQKLEMEIADKTASRFAIGVASGSDALYLALAALGIGPGDEVITPAFTFFATAGSITRTGAKPVFADVDPETFNIDARQIASKITPRTKAILPVHLFGLPADMEAILRIAKAHSLFVIEDAAQSFGSTFKGKMTGAIGDAGGLSFFPTKNLGGAGDGGMVLTSSESLADKIKLLRVHGSRKKYHHDAIGINSRLDEIQAAVLRVKLKYIDRWNSLRERHAENYRKGLDGLPVKTPMAPEGYHHTYHLYSIRTEKRDALADFLGQRGIGTGVYYPIPLHLQPCYQFLGYQKGDLPHAERLSSRILSLPMFPELLDEDISYVCASIREFFSS